MLFKYGFWGLDFGEFLRCSASPKPNPSNSTSHVEGTATETALLRGPEVLVFCAACKFAGPSREPLQNLLQCSVCRVWAHKACVVTTFTSQQESVSILCLLSKSVHNCFICHYCCHDKSQG